MASVEERERGGKPVWWAHYRTPGRAQRDKTFLRKIDAERFLASVESSKNAGAFVDPALSRVTLGSWSQVWLDGQAPSNRRPTPAVPGFCASTWCRPGGRCAGPRSRTPTSRPG